MRIIDWSSDVCSSVLHYKQQSDEQHQGGNDTGHKRPSVRSHFPKCPDDSERDDGDVKPAAQQLLPEQQPSSDHHRHAGNYIIERPRSEEHASELQSLMRISYAVFCSKKKKNTT